MPESREELLHLGPLDNALCNRRQQLSVNQCNVGPY